MVLVMWGHLLGTGMYALEIPGIIKGAMDNPIISYNGDFLSTPDMFFYYRLNTQAAILGVVMFFMCTGYFVPAMRKRYTRREFFVNRFFRIFPTLWVCMIFVGAIAFLSQGIQFSLLQYITSGLLLHQLFHVVPIMSLLWTLVIEFVFYLLSMLFDHIDVTFIIWGYAITLLFGLIYYEFGWNFLGDSFYNMRFVLFILMGTAFYIDSKGTNLMARYRTASVCLVCNLLIFQISRILIGDETTYPNFFSQTIPFVLMVLLLELESFFPELFQGIPSLIYHLAKLVFPVFLTHISVGITMMYWLSRAGVNRYLIVLAGFVASFTAAELIALTVEKYSIKLSRSLISRIRERS